LKIDDVSKELLKKSANYATVKEINIISQQLESKANINEVNEALSTKASKESVISALHRKANKTETESLLNIKVDMEDFNKLVNLVNNKLDIMEFDKFQSYIETKADKSELINITNTLGNKADIKDFDLLNVCYQELKRETGKKIDDLDQDIDKLIEEVKKEFQNINISMNNLETKKVDLTHYDKIANILAKKADSDYVIGSVSQVKNDVFEHLIEIKSDMTQARKIYEDKLNEKISIAEKHIELLQNDYNKNKDRFIDLENMKRNESDDLIKQNKTYLNNIANNINLDINTINNELNKMKTEFEEIVNRKSDKKEIEFIKNKLFTELNQKVKFLILTYSLN
jgi:hypothetical protein